MKQSKNIKTELNPTNAGLEPGLSSIEKKEAFSVPENYFDSLPAQIMDKITADPLLNTIANPFAVPENYFNELPVEVSKSIEAGQRKRFNLAGLLATVLRPKYSLSLITACFALFICIRFFEKPVVINAAGVISSSASVYNIDFISEVDENALMEEISEHNDHLFAAGNKTSGDKEIEDYIINNNIDISEIINEL